MATQKQKRVAKLIVANASLDKPLNGGEIVENSGYGVSMSKNPQVILNSEGVQDELEVLGFTEENAKKVVQQIMMSEETDDNARLKAADMVFKVKGTYAPEKKKIEGSLDIHDTDELKKIADEVEERYDASRQTSSS